MRMIITSLNKKYHTMPSTDGAQKNDVKIDSYFEKLMKLIPAEIVAGYIAINGILESAQDGIAYEKTLLFVFLFMFAGIPIVKLIEDRKFDGIQYAVAYFAFFIWIFALGGPFKFFDWYHEAYGTIAIIIATPLMPGIVYILESLREKIPYNKEHLTGTNERLKLIVTIVEKNQNFMKKYREWEKKNPKGSIIKFLYLYLTKQLKPEPSKVD